MRSRIHQATLGLRNRTPHCVTALLTGQPIEGTWFDRTREWEARLRGEEFGARQFATIETVKLAPLPCWRHLSPEQYRDRIAELIEAIIAQAAARRSAVGIEPPRPGRDPPATAVLSAGEDQEIARAAGPRRHQTGSNPDEDLLAWFARAFREAAEYLRAGDRLARFPLGSFPPGLPFVRAGRFAIRAAS